MQLCRVVPFCRVLIIVLALVACAARAEAQTFGIRGGASVDPDQVYVGAHVNVGPLVEQLYFRPNLEVGFGDDLTLPTANFEFVYRIPLDRSPWWLYAGGGPTINFYRFEGGRDDTEAGFNFIFGAEHPEGFFTEVKIGAGDSPDFKFGIGYTFR